MARADIIVNLIKSGYSGDRTSFRKIVETLISEEQAKNHYVFANQLRNILYHEIPQQQSFHSITKCDDLIFESIPKRKLGSLVLNDTILKPCKELVEEHNRSELLRSYGLEPRHRILLKGPPGNGKTSLAEAMAVELMYPLFTIRYESLIGSYLGETATRLQKIFDYVATRKCILFFDEFDTLAKERGDTRETGEIKRVVSSLLLQIDRLPSYVVVITASNHPELLDRAVWRRFQLKLDLSLPKKKDIEQFVKSFSDKTKITFDYRYEYLAKQLQGLSFSDIENFCLDILRQFILSKNHQSTRIIVKNRLNQLRTTTTNSKNA